MVVVTVGNRTTITVGTLQRLLAGLPDGQPLLLVDDFGVPVEIADVHPLTVHDQDGVEILTLEFETTDNCCPFEDDDETRISTAGDD